MLQKELIGVFVDTKMVAAALLLGRYQDVRPGCWDPLPEEQLHPQQVQSLGAVPHAEERQAGGSHRLLRR